MDTLPYNFNNFGLGFSRAAIELNLIDRQLNILGVFLISLSLMCMSRESQEKRFASSISAVARKGSTVQDYNNAFAFSAYTQVCIALLP